MDSYYPISPKEWIKKQRLNNFAKYGENAGVIQYGNPSIRII